jgi:ABC transport system ATP-binding/permease protein
VPKSDDRPAASPVAAGGRSSGSLLYGGRRFDLGPEGLTVGRGEESDVVLGSERVSRAHARVDADEEGDFWITDLKSRHGTLVNGERFRDAARKLASGDTISIEDETLRFLGGQETRLASRELPILGTQLVQFDGRRLTIGRDAANDVVLADPNVSRFHAEVVAGDGRFELVDLDSRNGSRLNGELVTRAPVTSGAEIGIGPYRLVFDGTAFLARDDRGALRLDAEEVAVIVKGKQILARTSLALEPGEFVAIIGESGSGKTTLVKALAGVASPSQGRITVNGEPVALRLTDIGYVPQEEIVHAQLSITEALNYAARLRLPEDTSMEEIETSVAQVLDELALTEHADTRIGLLSGGQRKRAGVAAELLNRPSLLFLDEPTSGLDPGLETKMMVLLRALADRSRAVGVVTHATKNLGLCDKLAVMARGGEMSFYGSPEEGLDFFGVKEYDGIYSVLDERPPVELRKRDRTRDGAPPAPEAIPESAEISSRRERLKRRRFGPQVRVLAHRYLQVFARDRRNLLILLGQVPLLALAIAGLFEADVFVLGRDDPNQVAQILFLLITTAIWFGSIDASREIIKERGLAARERAVGVRTSAYLVSKLLVLFALAAIQTLLLAAIVFGLRPMHEPVDTYAEVIIILTLTSFAALGMGLLISALVRSEDQATSFIPLVLIPQLLFSGAIVAVDRMSEPVATLSSVVFAQWSFAGAGTAVDMNGRIGAVPEYAKVNDYGTSFFDVSSPAAYLVLGAFLAVFLIGVGALLRNRSA